MFAGAEVPWLPLTFTAVEGRKMLTLFVLLSENGFANHETARASNSATKRAMRSLRVAPGVYDCFLPS